MPLYHLRKCGTDYIISGNIHMNELGLLCRYSGRGLDSRIGLDEQDGT
jgi:hypothetical protein